MAGRGTESGSTFRARHREFAELVRELTWVRNHNLKFKEGDPQDSLLLFAEAGLVLVAFERFLRMIVPAATPRHTLFNLLEMATRTDRPLLRLPGPRDVVIRQLTDVRNTLLHGNYEQAASQARCADVPTYFKTQFAPEIEEMYTVLDKLIAQIDPETGAPYQD